MKLLLAFCAVLFLAGCAKHGLMVETGKDYKGTITIGWGPMTVFDADVNGEFRACIPSKEGMDGTNVISNWCSDWLKSRSPEGQ